MTAWARPQLTEERGARSASDELFFTWDVLTCEAAIEGEAGAAIPGDEFLARFHPQDLAEMRSAIDRAARSGCPSVAETRMRGANGYRWRRLRVAPLPGPDGARLVGSLADIDRERTLDNALDQLQWEHEALLEKLELMRAQFQFAVEVVEADRLRIWDLNAGADFFVRLAELTGHADTDAIRSADDVRAICYPQDWIEFESGLNRLQGGEPGTIVFDYRIRAADGSWQWVRTRGGVWRHNGDEDKVTCAGTHAIITLERELIKKRAREEALYMAFLENAPASVAMLDRDLRYIYTSRRWLIDFGLADQDIIGRCHYDVFPEISEDWKAVHRRGLAGFGEKREIDKFVRADGSVQYLKWEVLPWYAADGTVGGLIFLTEEITEAQRRLHEMARNQERLYSALKIGEASVWEVELETNRFVGMVRHSELTGLDQDDAMQWANYFNIVHPDDRKAVLSKWEDLYKTGAMEIDHRLRRADGSYRWVRAHASHMRDSEGKMREIGFLKDVSSLKEAELAARRAEERAIAASAAKSQFLATMSHEIRTPMNGVLGMASALAATALSQEQREMLDVIQSSGEDLLTILNDLLDLSKAEAGKIEIQVDVFSLELVARRAVTLYSRAAAAKGLALELTLDVSAKSRLTGDEVRIRQILHNLISNAVKFTEKGRIDVRVSQSPRPDGRCDVVVEVVDTGVGIPPERLETVFEPFVQVDSSVTRRFAGTGLGLTIVKLLAEKMGGTISVESKPGMGTTFRFTLVLDRASGDALSQEPSFTTKQPAASEEPLRILVAEDNRQNQLVVQAILGVIGADLTFVEDGESAVARWQDGGFDFVLMDVRMPGSDGLWATRRIREIEGEQGRAHTPIIAVTADATPERVAEALASGMDAHLAKPIGVKPLLALVGATAARLAS